MPPKKKTTAAEPEKVDKPAPKKAKVRIFVYHGYCCPLREWAGVLCR